MSICRNNDKAILLDVDGVLSEWIAACCKLMDKDYAEVLRDWPAGTFYMENVLDMDTKEYWDIIDQAGEDYWATLPLTSWASTFYAKCIELAPTFFLTSPSRSPSSMSGKLRWIHDFTGKTQFTNFLVGRPKFLCANCSNILVDDADHNVNEFISAGGKAILFPRHWNSRHGDWAKYGEDTYKVVLDEISYYL